MKKKILSILSIALALSVLLAFVPAASVAFEPLPFDGADDWAVAELEGALANELVMDFMIGNWRAPTNRLNAAEAIAKLAEAVMGMSIEEIAEDMGFDMSDTFEDTDNIYAAFLKAAGISVGMGGGVFGTDGIFSRIQMVMMLGRMAENVLGTDLSDAPMGSEMFTDIPDWPGADMYVGWAYQTGITQGQGGGIFGSNDPLQNQHTAMFANRALDNLQPTPTDSSVVKNFIVLTLDDPYMSVNGVKQEVDPVRGTAPFLTDDGRGMVPIEAIIEVIGGTFGWNPSNGEISLTRGRDTVLMWLNNTIISANGTTKLIDTPPAIVNGTIMVPLRYAFENLNCAVDWLNSTRQYVIVFYAVDSTTAQQPEPTEQFILLTLDDPYMSVNGVRQEMDPDRGTVPFETDYGRIMAPIESIIVTIGGTFGWNPTNDEISLTYNGNTVLMWLNNTIVSVNGTIMLMDTPPATVNGRMVVPLEYAVGHLGCVYYMSNLTRQILIVFE